MTDRLPPHAAEAEQAIIGCCLNSPVDCLPESQLNLKAESFYDLRNKTLWEMMSGMEPSTVNVISIRQKLKDAGMSDKIDMAHLSNCQDAAFSTANLPTWIKEVSDKQTLRAIISTCTTFVQRVYEGQENAAEILDEIERAILDIRPHKGGTEDIKDLVQKALLEIEVRLTAGNRISGLSTGLIDLDRITDGLHKAEVVVVAAFPSCGKTALAVNIAVTNALAGIPSVIFSAEMRPVKLVVRSICSESRVNFRYVDEASIPKMIASAERLAMSKLIIEQANRMSIGQVMARARRLKQTHNIQLAVVDYIQLLTGTGDNREQEISSISKGIKAMALELEIPVLALSQLTDDGKLRESRAIGQDADSVWRLENSGDWQAVTQPIKLRVDKCRDGSTGSVDLVFMKEITRFENQSNLPND